MRSDENSSLELEVIRRAVREPHFPPTDLADRLVFGELPGIAIAPRAQRAELLRTCSIVFLEEEWCRESLVETWPAVARFLQLAAA